MWQKIIERMYDDSDADALVQRIADNIASKRERSQDAFSTAQKKLSRDEMVNQNIAGSKISSLLVYADFQKIILDFQLQEHERFLSKFTEIFKEIDTDTDGIVSEQEFRDLMGRMGVVTNPEDVQNMLHIVDPFNN